VSSNHVAGRSVPAPITAGRQTRKRQRRVGVLVHLGRRQAVFIVQEHSPVERQAEDEECVVAGGSDRVVDGQHATSARRTIHEWS